MNTTRTIKYTMGLTSAVISSAGSSVSDSGKSNCVAARLLDSDKPARNLSTSGVTLLCTVLELSVSTSRLCLHFILHIILNCHMVTASHKCVNNLPTIVTLWQADESVTYESNIEGMTVSVTAPLCHIELQAGHVYWTDPDHLTKLSFSNVLESLPSRYSAL